MRGRTYTTYFPLLDGFGGGESHEGQDGGDEELHFGLWLVRITLDTLTMGALINHGMIPAFCIPKV
jgi:hypothetical protein